MKRFWTLLLVTALALPSLPSNASDNGLDADVWTYGFNGIPERSTSVYPVCTTAGVITEVQTLDNLFGPAWDDSVEVANCDYDYVLVNLTGYITLDPGTYTFNFVADDGLYLKIGDQVLTTDAVDWIIKPPGGSQGVQFVVRNHYSQAVDFWFFDNEYGSFADVEILDSRGNEVNQAGLFTKTPARVPVTPPAYEGPLNLSFKTKANTCPSLIWQISGQRLTSIREFTIGGKSAKVLSSSDSLVEIELPADLSGKQRLIMGVPASSLNLTHDLVIPALSECQSTLKLFGFGTRASALNAAQLDQISDFIATGKSTRLVCVGVATTSEGSNARRLALLRAQSACKAGKLAQPDLQTSLFTSLKAGNSPQFRGVTLKLVTSR